MDPPELPVAQLVRLTGLFGISENRARVALSRMVAGGEATSDGAGRYRLAGHLAARQSRQSASRAGVTCLRRRVVAGRGDDAGSTADVRGARRRALAYARLAELREGVWMRPANVALRLPDSLEGDVELMTARPGTPRAGGSSVGPDGVVGARRRPLRRLDALAPTGPRRWRRGSSSRPPCCATSRRPAAARRAPPAGWPGAALRARLRRLGRPLPGDAARLEPASWTRGRLGARGGCLPTPG